MKKNYYFAFIALAFFAASNVSAQDTNGIKEDAAVQKTINFESGLSKSAAISAFTKMYNLGKGNVFEAKKENSDISGMTHQRHQQFFKGIKVEYGVLIIHSKNGGVVSVNGELYNAENLNLTPSLTPQAGLQIAIDQTPSEKYMWEDAVESANMDYKKPTGELVIYPIVNTGAVRLAYKYDIFSITPILREEIYVDAHTGSILFRNPIIKHANAPISSKQAEAVSKKIEEITVGSKSAFAALVPSVTAATRYDGNKVLETTFDAGLGKYVLNDLTRGNGVVTYNSAKTPTMPSTPFTDTDNSWTAAEYSNANKDNAALSAHWGAEMTFDFWKNIFGRNSFDDNNGQIRSYVHYDDVAGGAGWDNAQWTGSVMRYGDGSSFDALTSIDVIGHEIGHAICQYTAGLAYQNQSGAMNEGYSDIWGACIEQYGKFGNLNSGTDTASPGTLAVWKIGEQLAASPLRSMSYPLTRGNPDTYKGTSYTTTGTIGDGTCVPSSSNDNCGVHNNSGVFNHWFYILTAGKSGTNNAPVVPAPSQRDTYAVTGIGMAKSSQIAYYMERDYLTANSSFVDARNASLAVAGNLYCGSSPEYIAVMDSWFAVNVGGNVKYVAQANDVALKSIVGTSSIACGVPYSASIVFENTGTASISTVNVAYTIDGGAPTNLIWNGTLANCSTEVYPVAIGVLSRGTHVLSVTTTITSDGNAANNTKTTLITVNDAGTIGTTNTFNTAAEALVSIDEAGTNTVWERGTSLKTKLSNAVAGSQVYATKLAGNYPDKTTAYLVSQCYDLSNVATPTVSFDMGFDLESNWDIIYFEYSANSGSSWNVLGNYGDANWYNSPRLPDGTDCFNCIGKQWTGDYATAPVGGNGVNGNKRNYSHTLAPFGAGGATPASNIMFRFVIMTDDSVNQEGAIIDNFLIQGTVLGTAQNNFSTFSLYPNPSKGTVILSLSATTDVKVSLFDISGRNIYAKSFSNSDITFTQELQFNGLSKGVYILNVESDGKKASKKLIID